ncbi:MAG: AAA family ATPase [bacterium]|nr:AAA family ATPase [bacterium]
MISSLIGHRDVLESLSVLLKGERMPHGLLLAGPEGIGKSRVATALRYALLEGETQLSFPPPGNTTTSQLLKSGAHPDTLWITRKVNEKTGKLSKGIKVDEARTVARFFQRKPALSKRRVVVVDAVDDLNMNGANALLKVLEEPPKEAILILIAHRMSKVLPTLRSRAQLIPFRPLDSKDMKTFMGQELGSLSPEDQACLSVLSAGSPGRAKMLFDQGGVKIFQGFLKVVAGFNAPGFESTLSEFVSHVTARPKKGQTNEKTPFEILRLVMEIWMARAVKLLSLGSEAEPLPQEKEAINALNQLGSVALWAQAWSQLAPIFDEADVFALDPSSVLLDIFARWKGLIPLVRAV